MDDLRMRISSRRLWYSALVRWCGRDRRQEFAGHVGGNITFPEARELAEQIGETFWGQTGPYVMKRKNGVRALPWPLDEDVYAFTTMGPVEVTC